MDIKVTKTSYVKDGKEYDRITSVLDYFQNPKLVEWKIKNGKEANKISKVSKQIGTRVDGLIKEHTKSGKIRLTSKESGSVTNCIRGYLQWNKDFSPKIVETDTTLFWDELGVAGTLDLLTSDCVIDIKCANSIKKNYWIQVMMYAKMKREMGERIGKVGILRLDKLTGEYEYKLRDYDERYVSLFIGLLANYRFQKEEENGDTGSDEAGIVLAFDEIEKKYGF